jgi:hypothetical protein
MKIEINTKNIRIAVEDEPTTSGGSWTLRRVPEFPDCFKLIMDAIKELDKSNPPEVKDNE